MIALVAAGVGIATKWSLVPAAAVTVVALAAPVRRRLRLCSSVTIASLVGACVVVTTAAWGPVVLGPGTDAIGAVARMTTESVDMARYHVDLTRTGAGHAGGWTWLAQTSPTVLYEMPCAAVVDRVDHVCRGRSSAPARIVAAGNVVLWGAGSAALVALAMRVRRSPPAAVTVALAAATWLPWVLPGTAPYSYYGAVVSPVLAVAVAQALAGTRQRRWASVAIGALAGAWLLLHYPDLTAMT